MRALVIITLLLMLTVACSPSPEQTVEGELASTDALSEQEFRQYVRNENAANLLGAAIGCGFLKGLDSEEAARWISSSQEAQKRVADDPNGQRAAEIIIEECQRLGFLD